MRLWLECAMDGDKVEMRTRWKESQDAYQMKPQLGCIVDEDKVEMHTKMKPMLVECMIDKAIIRMRSGQR